MKILRACLDPRVLLALGGVALAIFVLAPSLVLGVIPLLIVAACPLSMVVMMATMRQGQAGQAQAGAARAPDDVRRELADLGARQRRLEAELAASESIPSPRATPGSPRPIRPDS
jgi:Protein of unknown function (DUF2933)